MNTPPSLRVVKLATALRRASISALLVWGTLSPAHADSGALMPRAAPPAYAKECGACHTAYPPALLPAPSWRRIMGGLDRHYGADASLDDASVREIGAWLEANAGTYKRVAAASPPQDRITRSPWFERKHRKLAPTAGSHPSVKSAAQCGACHTRADQGDYDDDDVRLPAGLEAALRGGVPDPRR